MKRHTKIILRLMLLALLFATPVTADSDHESKWYERQHDRVVGDQALHLQGVNALPTPLDTYRMLRASRLSVLSTGESETFLDWLAFKVQTRASVFTQPG